MEKILKEKLAEDMLIYQQEEILWMLDHVGHSNLGDNGFWRRWKWPRKASLCRAGYAMKNESEIVKRVAKYQAPGNQELGVLEALEQELVK